MAQITEKVDVCVIGAGHAGCEAALACARMGLETVIFTVSIESIALMPCNPNIGGSSKGHLVRELDALGGEMGKNIDHTFIQSKMLNASKGPAVHSLRAQADKAEYSRRMRQILENQEHLVIKQAEVCDLLWDDVDADTVSGKAGATKKIRGVRTFTGTVYEAKAVILCTGTYLKARCLCGESITYTGPNGLQAANHLTDSLKEMGIAMRRFKTGTPARMDKRSIDFSKMEEQFGDPRVVPFSFSTDPESVQIDQDSCWLTYTNEKTHEIIRANLDRSPIYAGIIEGTGPRYCPSIEDKVVKFADKERHQVIRMKCMSVACRLLCRRMCRLPCIGRFRGWKTAGSCAMHMRLNMIASTQDSCTRRWNLRMLRGFFRQDSSMEAAAMRKRLPRAFLQESMRV